MDLFIIVIIIVFVHDSCRPHHHVIFIIVVVVDTRPIEGTSGSCHDIHQEHCTHEFGVLENRFSFRIMTGIEPTGDHQITGVKNT